MWLPVAAIVICAGIGGLSILFAVERRRCPVCRRRSVAMRFTDGYSDGETHIVSYRCKHRSCRAEFRTHNGGPLIPRDAFDQGVREPVPQATVVKS